MAKHIRNSNVAWGFFKADHKDAYKQLLLDQEYANLTLVAIRNAASWIFYAFGRRVLLFGAVSEVIHYNCFSRIFSVLAKKIFGFPALTISMILVP